MMDLMEIIIIRYDLGWNFRPRYELFTTANERVVVVNEALSSWTYKRDE